MKTELELACEKNGIRIRSVYGETRTQEDEMEAWQREAHPYRVTLLRGKKQMSVDFWQGPALTDPPRAADVLYCLLMDARAGDVGFEEWCSEFGYDTDSRRAERSYRLCRDIAKRLHRFLGPDLVAELEQKEH